MDSHLLRSVLRWNPWLDRPSEWERAVGQRIPASFVSRSPAGGVPGVDPKRALVVVGPRQAGKSTFLWDLIKRRHSRCLYLHCEDRIIAEWCKSPSAFAADFDSLPAPMDAVFLDEAQHLEEAGLFVKGLVDIGLPVSLYVTGSSSYHLRSRTRESLAGRAARLRIYPFSLGEVLAAEGGTRTGPGVRLAADRAWERQMRYGCFPEVYLSGGEEELLFNLVESFVLRDASDLFKIQRPAALRKLLRLMAGQSGNLVRMSEWAALCEVSAPTVAEYAALLEECHVIRLLPVFHGGRRAELTATPKISFVDNGIRNLLAGDFSPIETRADVGALFENWVFGELTKTLMQPDDLHYWRTRAGAEVDFVIHRPGLAAVAVEAKLDAIPPRISRGARSFIEAYEPAVFITVTRNAQAETKVGTTRCVWCRPHDLVSQIPRPFLTS